MTPTPTSPLRIGTRGSPLALAQAHETRARLMAAHDLPEDAFEIVVIKTTGDRIQDRPLSEIGGKGLFTKEIEEAMLRGDIAIAVHSMKDMPVAQPEGLVLDCFLPREDPRDAFLSPKAASIHALPEGAIVGTSSLRRRAQLKARRPDLNIVEFRGNVQTRLRKLNDGVAAATFLAMAGLNRLKMEDIGAHPIDTADMLPAVAQGIIGIERRASDTATAALLEPLNDANASYHIRAERSYLARLDGSCETPIAGLSTIDGTNITLTAEVLRPDGSEVLTEQGTAPLSDAEALGRSIAETLLSRAPANFFDWRT